MKQFFLSERNMMIAILINSVIIFMMYFPQFKDDWWLEAIDHLFIFFFVLEALVKLYVYKPRQYFQLGWNRFDFMIVVLTLPTLLTSILPIPNTALLVVLRLFRLVRLVRFIRFIPNLSKIMSGLGRALKASVFVLLALLLFNFLVAIFSCHFFSHTEPELFGDPLISAYSTFQMFTVEGWNEITDATTDDLQHPIFIGLTRFYFVLVVLIGGIFGMSLANAVFVDEMTMDNNTDLEGKIEELKLEISELKELLRAKV